MVQPPQNIELLKKRARAKYFTHSYIFKLINLNTEMKKSYYQTVDCASIITQADDKLTARYCNQRWCTVCNRIRIAKFINSYGDQLKQFVDPYFITLTVPNSTKENLKSTLETMDKNFNKIVDRLKKQNIKIKAIRKTECTLNATTNTYHPHFHLIVENFPTLFNCENDLNSLYYVKYNSVIAELRKNPANNKQGIIFLSNLAKLRFNTIINLWLGYNSDANIIAQDCRPCTENSEVEIFKYFTKVITKIGGQFKFFPEQFDHIFTTIKGKRTFRTFGLKKQINEDIDELETVSIEDLEQKFAIYQFHSTDWYDVETGEALCNYEPSEVLKTLTKNL